MTIEEASQLKKLIDELTEQGVAIDDTTSTVVGETRPARDLPKDKRVVRTKQTGDRVYLLDENKKTRQWVYSPEVLQSIGFEMSDVIEIDDLELSRYSMGAALYKVDNETINLFNSSH